MESHPHDATGAPPPDVARAASELEALLPWRPEVSLVLGSGLGGLAEGVEGPVEVPFQRISGFPPPAVEGHAGRFIAGEVEGCRVLMQAGRFHFYEGHPAAVVTLPVRVAATLGVSTAVFTNAAGGIDRRLAPGSLMLLDDHLHLQWRSPLAGPPAPGEERFPDMSAPYDGGLQELALEVAAELGIPLARGVYAAVLGPTYETPAEIRMLKRLGADAVGMSTVPEVIAARARGLRVLGLSLITNRAAGLADGPLSHQEVLETGSAAAGTLEGLVRGILAGTARG